jgi:hypothetical protein
MISEPDPAVAEVFASYPPAIRKQLTKVRRLIFQTAAATDGVGPVTEALRWGEPAYLTLASKSGSTIRLGWNKAAPAQWAIYFNCQTNLVDSFRTRFPELRFDGNRAVIFETTEALPAETLAECVAAALTYHRTKRARRKPAPQVRG